MKPYPEQKLAVYFAKLFSTIHYPGQEELWKIRLVLWHQDLECFAGQ